MAFAESFAGLVSQLPAQGLTPYDRLMSAKKGAVDADYDYDDASHSDRGDLVKDSGNFTSLPGEEHDDAGLDHSEEQRVVNSGDSNDSGYSNRTSKVLIGNLSSE